MNLKKSCIKILFISIFFAILFNTQVTIVQAKPRSEATQSNQRVEKVNKAIKTFIDEYKIHLAGFIGLGILSSLISFIVNFLRLGWNGHNHKIRPQIINNLIVSGVCTALLGSFGLVISLVYTTFL